MPFDLVADFVRPPECPPERLAWTKVALAFAKSLVADHPRLRFRILRLPEDSDTRERRAVPKALSAEHVPEQLKGKVQLPEPTYFWVKKIFCKDCGVSVSHGQRLLHSRQGHELIFGDITHRGIKRTWRPNYRVFLGGERLYDRGSDGYSIAVTAAPVDFERLRYFDAVLLLRMRNRDHDADLAALRDALRAEHTVLLPQGFAPSVDAFVDWYARLDGEAMEPDAKTPEEEEEAEYQRQADRQRGAMSYLARARPGKTNATKKASAPEPSEAPTQGGEEA